MFLECKEPIILASQSPRRKQLLTQIGVKFDTLSIEIDESTVAGEEPLAYVNRMAKTKAEAAYSSELFRLLENTERRAILSADTSVVLGREILGKPTDIDHAQQMLATLSDTTHQVMTSVALLNKVGISMQTSVTDVSFARLSKKMIEDYCCSKEGVDKAGGYAIQGAAAVFVRAIKGSYSGVVGLPLFETHQLLEQHFKEVS